MAPRSREFHQPPVKIWVGLGLPTLVAAVGLAHQGYSALDAWSPVHVEMRLLFGYLPFLWAAGLLLGVYQAASHHAGVIYVVTGTSLVRRSGRRVETMRLEHLYVNRSSATLLPSLRISDGRKSFVVMALFMRDYEKFASLLETGSRLRRAEQSL